jgi:hypothetical protein
MINLKRGTRDENESEERKAINQNTPILEETDISLSMSHPPVNPRSRAEGKSTWPVLPPLNAFAGWKLGIKSSSPCTPASVSQSTSSTVEEADVSESPKRVDMGVSAGRLVDGIMGEAARISRRKSSMASSSVEFVSWMNVD